MQRSWYSNLFFPLPLILRLINSIYKKPRRYDSFWRTCVSKIIVKIIVDFENCKPFKNINRFAKSKKYHSMRNVSRIILSRKSHSRGNTLLGRISINSDCCKYLICTKSIELYIRKLYVRKKRNFCSSHRQARRRPEETRAWPSLIIRRRERP